MLYLGCDVHRDYTTISVVTEENDILETRNVLNNREGVVSLLQHYPEGNFL